MRHLPWIFCLLAIPCSAPGQPMTLDTLMRQTVDRNPEIQQAKLKLEQAMGRRLVFRSVGYPDAVLGILLGDQGGHRSKQN